MNYSNSKAWDLLNQVNYNELTPDELDIMMKVIRKARNLKGRETVRKVKMGDRVNVITGRKTNRGKIPQQMMGIVKEFKRTRVVVDCGEYGMWRVPGSCLKVI